MTEQTEQTEQGIRPLDRTEHRVETWVRLLMMAGGNVTADQVNRSSPGLAREVVALVRQYDQRPAADRRPSVVTPEEVAKALAFNLDDDFVLRGEEWAYSAHDPEDDRIVLDLERYTGPTAGERSIRATIHVEFVDQA